MIHLESSSRITSDKSRPSASAFAFAASQSVSSQRKFREGVGIGLHLDHSDSTAGRQVDDRASMGLHDHAIDHLLVVVLEELGGHGGLFAVGGCDNSHFESSGVQVAVAHSPTVPTAVPTVNEVAA